MLIAGTYPGNTEYTAQVPVGTIVELTAPAGGGFSCGGGGTVLFDEWISCGDSENMGPVGDSLSPSPSVSSGNSPTIRFRMDGDVCVSAQYELFKECDASLSPSLSPSPSVSALDNCPTDDCPTGQDLFCADFNGIAVCGTVSITGTMEWEWSGVSCFWVNQGNLSATAGRLEGSDIFCGAGDGPPNPAGFWGVTFAATGDDFPIESYLCRGNGHYLRAADGNGDLPDGLYSLNSETCNLQEGSGSCSGGWPSEVTLYT